MARGRNPLKVLKCFSAISMLLGLLGFVVSMTLNAFVLEDFDAHGEVPIPGTRTLHLPAGEVTVNYHARIYRPTRIGGGLPLPDVRLDIVPPTDVADPQVTEDIHAPTIVNEDAHRRMWVVTIPVDGDYRITTSGSAVGAAFNPSLTFGRDLRIPWLPWLFGFLFAFGLIALIAGSIWLTRRRRASRRKELDALAALRDAGAITAEQFLAEEQRILFG